MCTVLVVLAQCPCCEQSVNVSNDYGHVKGRSGGSLPLKRCLFNLIARCVGCNGSS